MPDGHQQEVNHDATPSKDSQGVLPVVPLSEPRAVAVQVRGMPSRWRDQAMTTSYGSDEPTPSALADAQDALNVFDEEAWEREYNDKMAAAVAALSPRWGVKAYKAHNTRDGVAFVFTLTDGGEPVAWVEDSGQGGGPWAQFNDRHSPSAIAFDEEAKTLFGGDFSPSELLIEAILQKAGKY